MQNPSSPKRPTRQRVKSLRETGMEPREIAAALNITTQRVYQHLAALGMSPSKSSSEGAA